jgi:hypothetical protein
VRVTRIHESNPLGNIKTTFPTASPLCFALNLLNLSGAGLPEAGELAGQPAAHLVVSSIILMCTLYCTTYVTASKLTK